MSRRKRKPQEISIDDWFHKVKIWEVTIIKRKWFIPYLKAYKIKAMSFREASVKAEKLGSVWKIECMAVMVPHNKEDTNE